LDGETAEMKEIKQVMFNMGMDSGFESVVDKNIAGKNYHNELASEVERFLTKVIDKFGGVLGLIDLYCMYNRARGADMISPDDLKVVCDKLHSNSSLYQVKTYGSGVKTIQSRTFSEDAYY
jgi:ESCRT-II complex subunit VPS36